MQASRVMIFSAHGYFAASRQLAPLSLCFLLLLSSSADDWPMLGRDGSRNPASPEKNAPSEWNVVKGKNVKWKGKLGFSTFSTPVVSEGFVWIGTNSDDGAAPGAVLLCFRESDGELLYRHVVPWARSSRLAGSTLGLSASPLVEGNRLWFTTLDAHVICLDIGALRTKLDLPRELWNLNMVEEFNVFPRVGIMGGPQTCSIGASFGDYIYVITGNGRLPNASPNDNDPPSPNAPALVCLDKNNGKLIWEDNSPGSKIILGEWASPTVISVGGKTQVVAPQSDGWVRSFDTKTGELLWQFDINRKKTKTADRNFFVAPPVFYDGKVYVLAGGYIEFGEQPGRLVCIDPKRRGDISLELPDGKPNANSGAIFSFDDIGCSMGTVAIREDILVVADFSSFLFCLDAKTGRQHWKHDLKAHTLSSPLIVDNKIYISDEDGDVDIIEFGKTKSFIKQIGMEGPVYASPIYANQTLYIATSEFLYAITNDIVTPLQKEKSQSADWPQWRGPDRSNTSLQSGLLKEWPPEGPPLLWTASGLGVGIHSVSVANGRVYTSGNVQENEIAFAIDAETGSKVWARRLGTTIQESPTMRWLTQRSPTVDEHRVYSLTASGELICLSAADGQIFWRQDYSRIYGARRPIFGFADYPLVDGDQLICTPYGTNNFIVALDKKSGEVIWRSRPKDSSNPGYAAPVVSDACGVRQYVVFYGRGLAGFAADDGKLLWQYNRPNLRIGSSYTPIALGDFVLSPNGYGGGLVLIKLSVDNGNWAVTEIYNEKKTFDPFQDNTAHVGEHVYTCHADGLIACIESATGKVLWDARPTVGRGRLALTHADGCLYTRHANGVMTLAEVSPEGYRQKSTFQIPSHESSIGATFPVVARGRLYIRDNDRLHCFNISTNAGEAPNAPQRVAITLSPQQLSDGEVTPRPQRLGRDRAADAVYVPTPHDVVAKMLELAQVKKESIVVDLGSGDGRIVIAAAREYGCQAVGYEIDKRLVETSREAVIKENLRSLARIEHEDIFTRDLSNADVVTAFLYPRLMERLIPQLQKLKPGSRIVSHQFEIPGVTPDRVIIIDSTETGDKHRILLWTTPINPTEPTK